MQQCETSDVWQHVAYPHARVISAALSDLDDIWQDLLHQPLLDGRCMWQVYLKELRCRGADSQYTSTTLHGMTSRAYNAHCVVICMHYTVL